MSADSDFVHLHVHTDYSLLDGACRIDRLMDRAAALGMKALALTDHGNLYGAIDFYNAAKAKGIKPIIGCELYLAAGSRLDRTGRSDEGKAYFHLGLVARNLAGYQNLLKLISDAHLQGFYYKPRTDLETLARHAEGLIGFTGCLAAPIPRLLAAGRDQEAREMTARFVDIFGRDHYFVEIQDHGIPEQRRIIPGLLRLAREFGLRVVCTNDVHYVRAEDAGPHDTLLCIQTGAKLEDRDRMRFDTSEFYLKSRAEMDRLFAEVPGAVVNTAVVAEMCDLAIPFPKGSERYPRYPLPPEVKTDRAGYLRQLCAEGLRRRYGLDYAARALGPEARPEHAADPNLAATLCERIDFELGIIERTGYTDYFLVVWDFIDWARRQGIPVGPGRGSGAGSLAAYALGITDLDPLRFKLLFERFLNPERVSPPDFDIDFCMRRRGEVIDYVRRKYGNACVANIITYGTLGAKMVIRDVARVHNLPFAEADRLAKMIPDELNISLEDAVAKSAELRAELDRNPVARNIVAQARVLEGMVRNTGKHAAGIIITDRPLDEFVPLTLQEGDVTVQYDMNAVSKLGLLKMDFLGLKTLTVIADAVENIRRTEDPRFDIGRAPLDDPRTFELLNSGRTTGVFQLESTGMQALCRQLQVSSIDEIIALIALYRPGPMEWIPDYIRGKKDPATVKFPHPLLEDVCRETYGVMVYQEQVMEAARVIAGYTLGGADMLRRAMGKKDPEAMARERGKFVEGARRLHDIDERTSNAIFDILNKFAGYGFNKSHSAAYAILSYQTAYLKANYPVQFMAAVLSSELGNAEKVAHFIAEAEAMGLQVLGPDVNESRENFTPVVRPGEPGKIRFGFAGIKGVGEAAAQRLLAEREANGPYTGFHDLLVRVDTRMLNKRVLECLVLTGAFDSIEPSREELFAGIDDALAALAELQRKYPALRRDAPAAAKPAEDTLLLGLDLAEAPPPDRATLARELAALLRITSTRRPAPGPAPLADRSADQADLFGGAAAGSGPRNAARPEPAKAPERVLNTVTRLQFEKELLGFYVSGHPMNAWAGIAEAVNSHRESQLLELDDRAPFRLCGIASGIVKKLSKRDNRPWAAFSLATRDATVPLHIYADAFEDYGRQLENERPVVVLGTVLRGPDGARLNVKEVYPLEPYLAKAVRRITWLVRAEHPAQAEFLTRLRAALDAGAGDVRTEIGLLFPDGAVLVAETAGALGWRLDCTVFQELRRHPAVAGTQIETRPVELKESRRWAARAG